MFKPRFLFLLISHHVSFEQNNAAVFEPDRHVIEILVDRETGHLGKFKSKNTTREW